MKNLLVLAPYAVVPPRYGGPLRVYNLCRELSHSYRVTQFAQQVQRRNISFGFSPIIQTVTPTYVEYSCRNPLSIFLYALTSLKWNSPPIWQSPVLQISAPRWLYRQVEAAHLIHVEQPWQFQWIYRQVGERKPIILTAQNIEAMLYTPDSLTAPAVIARRIIREIEKQESFAVSHATWILTTSEADLMHLVQKYKVPADRCIVVPNGVDCNAFAIVNSGQREQRKREIGLSGKYVVLFAGSLHRPNVEAVRTIIGWAAQRLDESICFLIVGTVGQAFSREQLSNVKFTGPVEQTRPFFESADIAINPLSSGSGTSLKQLEFMAMGLPTVATPVGARGIPVRDEIHGYIRPLDDFCDTVSWLLAHPEIMQSVGKNAREFVERYFDWSIIANRVIDVYERIDNS